MIFQIFVWCLLIIYCQACSDAQCHIENNCKCSTTVNPLTVSNSPQLIALTFDESIVDNLYQQYWVPLLFDRKNPDGNSISATFFVPHEYTDYERVQDLYLRGFEIGVHSITKNPLQSYWKNATLETLIEEFKGQREIISYFANIPIEDIVAGRTPQLQIQGDKTVDAYNKSGLIYDNSWPTLSSVRLFPYTLDYDSTQSCTVAIQCPSQSHPGFWVIPITNIEGNENKQCNSLVTCEIEGSADEIASWLLNQVNRVRSSNRSPLNFRIDSYWFQFTDNSLEGFTKFLDEIAKLDDVFVVSQKQVLEWSKNPVDLSNFKTDTYERTAECSPVTCELKNIQDSYRYMKSCVACPAVYPWLGNPYGEAS